MRESGMKMITIIEARPQFIKALMSQAVPAAVIGWHHKYAELLEQFGQADVGLSSENCTADLLWGRCEDLWGRRQQVRDQIRDSLPAVETRIYQAGESLRSLFK